MPDIIQFQERKVPSSYLGDGVYAIFDGYGIWLHANSHDKPTDRIYLEPEVLRALVGFSEFSRTEEAINLVKGGKDESI